MGFFIPVKSKSLVGNHYKRMFVACNPVGFGLVVIVVWVHKCARALKIMICAKPSGLKVISLQKSGFFASLFE